MRICVMDKITPRFYAALFSAMTKEYQNPAEQNWVLCYLCTWIQTSVDDFSRYFKRQNYNIDIYGIFEHMYYRYYI